MWRDSLMMMIAFITFNSSLVPLIEGLCSSNLWEFEFSGVNRICMTCRIYRQTVIRLDAACPVRDESTHEQMRYVTIINQSRHIQTSHVTCIYRTRDMSSTNESCQSHTYNRMTSSINTSCRTYEWVMSHVRMSHVTHSSHVTVTYEWDTSHTNEACHVWMWVVKAEGGGWGREEAEPERQETRVGERAEGEREKERQRTREIWRRGRLAPQHAGSKCQMLFRSCVSCSRRGVWWWNTLIPCDSRLCLSQSQVRSSCWSSRSSAPKSTRQARRFAVQSSVSGMLPSSCRASCRATRFFAPAVQPPACFRQ